MKVVNATWEERNLGCRTVEITLEKDDLKLLDANELVNKIEEQRQIYDAKYIVIKVNTKYAQVNYYLQQAGFTLIENQIGLKLLREDAIVAYEEKKDLFEGIDYKVADENDVKLILEEVKKGIFITDRIAIDPKFGIEIANQRYANWIQDVVNNGATAILTLYEGRAFGFGIGKAVKSNRTQGILGGIFVGDENKNLGSLFVFAGLKSFIDSGYERSDTAVSSNNTDILQLHLMCNQKIKDIKSVFIKHY